MSSKTVTSLHPSFVAHLQSDPDLQAVPPPSTSCFLDVATFNACGLPGIHILHTLLSECQADVVASQELLYDTPSCCASWSPSATTSLW